MKKLLLLISAILLSGFAYGDYVNPQKLQSYWDNARSIDAELTLTQEKLYWANIAGPQLRGYYNFCNNLGLHCKHEAYKEAKDMQIKIFELSASAGKLSLSQKHSWFNYNECLESRAGCDEKPVAQTVPDLIDKYADKYGLSRERVHRIAYCESKYNPCAKYPITMSQDCSTSSRVQRGISTASGVYQFINSTRDYYSHIHGRGGYDKYHAEANIATAMAMFNDGLWSHRECK